jgi:hypothetical protein
MSEINQNTEETESQKSDKIEKKFASALNKLVAVVGGKENLKISRKTPQDQVGDVVSELFKEEREAVLVETKESLRNLLKQYAEMEKAVSDKRKELDKLEKQKKDEFSKAAENLFSKIEGVGEIEKVYYSALKSTVS